MLKIRFVRVGKKNKPFFRIAVGDSRRTPKGKFIEKLGYYNPLKKEKSINKERVLHWLSNGAQCSDTVHNLLVSLEIIKGPKRKIKIKSKKSSSAEATADKKSADDKAVAEKKSVDDKIVTDEKEKKPEEIKEKEKKEPKEIKEKPVDVSDETVAEKKEEKSEAQTEEVKEKKKEDRKETEAKEEK